MSIWCNGNDQRMTGTLGATIGYPVTMAGWVKITDHPAAIRVAVQLGNSNISFNDSIGFRATATDNNWAAANITGGGGVGHATVTEIVDLLWTPFIAIFVGDAERYLWFASGNDTNTTSAAVAQALQYLSLGNSLASTQDFIDLRLAEIAIWRLDNVGFGATQRAEHLAGKAPSINSAGIPLCYWSMRDNLGATIPNAGTDAAAALTVSGGATWSADHPFIDYGTYRLMGQGIS